MDLNPEQHGPYAERAQALLEKLARLSTTQAKSVSVIWCSMPPRETDPARRALQKAATDSGRKLIDDHTIARFIEEARGYYPSSGRAIWIAAGMAAQDASNALLVHDALDPVAVDILARAWEQGISN